MKIKQDLNLVNGSFDLTLDNKKVVIKIDNVFPIHGQFVFLTILVIEDYSLFHRILFLFLIHSANTP
jgi:hypothetical protein